MERNTSRRAAWLIAALLLSPLTVGSVTAQTATPTKYLMFQIFTAGPEFTTVDGQHVISELPDPNFIDTEAKSIVNFIGAHGDSQHRYGLTVGPLAMDYTDDQLRTIIQKSFAAAAKYNIAIAFHLDDSKFWSNRKDLWSKPGNVEWLDWSGTPNTGQYLNWGTPWKLAPQACFNSPAMLAEATRISNKVIGPAIAQQVASLHQSKKDSLFGGVIVGWETAIGRDYVTKNNLGYCALTNLGFSAKNQPKDIDTQLETVVKNWIGTWSSGLASAGVPSNKIYAHIAFNSAKNFSPNSSAKTYAQSVMYTPPPVAFSKSYLPGFSTYPDADSLSQIYTALGSNNNPPWISAEGTNVDIQSGPPTIPSEGMEDYLARMYNHGGVLTNIFGWNLGAPSSPFQQATENANALASYRKFLAGSTLNEKPLSQSYQNSRTALQNRMRALQGLIQSFLHAGGDSNLIQRKVNQLQVDAQSGDFDAMKADLDGIDALVQSTVKS